MSSPFTTLEEFNNALDGPTEGAIYTFANSPVINIIALLAAVGIFVWFIIATYSTHASPSSSVDKSLNHLSTFIVVGLLSAVSAVGHDSNRVPRTKQPTAQHKPLIRSAYRQIPRKVPLGLLGIVSVGLPSLGQRSKRKTRKKQSINFSREYRARR